MLISRALFKRGNSGPFVGAAGLLVAGLAACLVLAGCTQSSSAGDRVSPAASDSAGSELGYTSPDGATTILAPADREALAGLAGETLDGGQFDIADQLGSVVVLNVWASWCPPCRAESPDLAKVSRDLADEGVSFVGLNLKDSRTAAQAFVSKVGIDYPSLFDPDGTKLLALSGALPPTSLPATLVIDREGRVAARALGAVDESRLRGLIEPVLAEASQSPEPTGADRASP